MDFIAGGEPPLLITFGSMPYESDLDLGELVSMVIRNLNIRIIVVRGWGLNDTGSLEKQPGVKLIDHAPYDKLFPLVKAVIHHGGIGTMSACLESGKPFLTCPVLYPMGDQYFWGLTAWKKGVGLKPLPLKKLTRESFLSNVRELVNNEELYRRAATMARELHGERGVANAVKLIETI